MLICFVITLSSQQNGNVNISLGNENELLCLKLLKMKVNTSLLGH